MGVDVPRIEPIPLEEMTPEVRSIIEEGVASGTYATPIPLQIFAYKTSQIMMVNMARQAFGKNALLGGRITELLRIRSAQLGECQPCSQSRKHDSISDEDVACLIAPGHGGDLTEQERLAVEFLDLLSAEGVSVDANPTGAREADPRPDPDRRRLSGAVPADEAEDLARPHRQGEPSERRRPIRPESLRDRLELDGHGTYPRSRPLPETGMVAAP